MHHKQTSSQQRDRMQISSTSNQRQTNVEEGWAEGEEANDAVVRDRLHHLAAHVRADRVSCQEDLRVGIALKHGIDDARLVLDLLLQGEKLSARQTRAVSEVSHRNTPGG
jgi:hypothetical protein